MVLPSQARPVRKRTHMHSRRRKGRRRAAIAAVLVVAAVAAGSTVLLRDGDDGDAPQPLPAAAAIDRTPKPTQATPPKPRVEAAAPRSSASRTLAARTEAAGTNATRTESSRARVPAPAEPVPAREAVTLAAPAALAPGARARGLEQMEAGVALAESNRPVDARRQLTAALASGALAAPEAAFVRDVLDNLNQRLVFSPAVVTGDPFARWRVVAPSELLSGIVRDEGLDVDWRFILRINRVPSERTLRAGQRLKLITGPFHAVVDKSDFRLDLYLGSGAERVYVTSYPVGLGEFDSTPIGRFRVRRGSKLINPRWANPRTGELFEADDPANPIGEHWIGLEGLDEAVRDLVGYGIHGTIEPESIGTQSSMGCVRMRPEDVAVVYEVLMEGSSVIEIRE